MLGDKSLSWEYGERRGSSVELEALSVGREGDKSACDGIVAALRSNCCAIIWTREQFNL